MDSTTLVPMFYKPRLTLLRWSKFDYSPPRLSLRLAQTLLSFPIIGVFVLVLVLNARSESQDIWSSRVEVNPSRLSSEDPPLPDFASDRFTIPGQNKPTSDGIRDFSELAARLDDMTLVSNLKDAFEGRRPGTLVAMLGIETPAQEKSWLAASVSVNELAVPPKAYKAFQKALRALRKHHLEEARHEVEQTLTIWPRYSDALTLSAVLSLLENEPNAALEASKEAVQFDSTNGMAQIVLARVHNSRGEYDDALRVVEVALRLRPDAWEGYFERARAELAKAEFSASLADATRAGELAPQRTSTIHLLKGAALLNLSRSADGLAELQEYLQSAPVGAAAERVRLMLQHSQPIL